MVHMGWAIGLLNLSDVASREDSAFISPDIKEELDTMEWTPWWICRKTLPVLGTFCVRIGNPKDVLIKIQLLQIYEFEAGGNL